MIIIHFFATEGSEIEPYENHMDHLSEKMDSKPPGPSASKVYGRSAAGPVDIQPIYWPTIQFYFDCFLRLFLFIYRVYS